MDSLTIFTTSFLVALSGALMPGPVLTVTIGEAIRRGFIAGPLIMVGHAILELTLVLALITGLSTYLTAPTVVQTIGILGGGFLLFMGWGMIRDGIKGRVSVSINPVAAAAKSTEDKAERIPWVVSLPVTGILTSVSNPYWIIWWATVGLGYITVAIKAGTGGTVSFYSGHILADIAWYSLVAGIIASGRRFLTDRIYQGIIVLCGLFLLGLSVYFIYSGITGFFGS
ncbi:MAG: LysE family transporter [Chitinophagales bacterium]